MLIPARDPDVRLVALVDELTIYGFTAILIVDDGSHPDSAPVFNHLKTLPNVQVLCHAVNHGKGRALKTGFNYVLSNLPLIEGVITADADGQHAADDIVAVAAAMEQGSNEVMLGVREFAKDVPLRNRFGNVLTKLIFEHITGMNISDTQTGLRAFPRSVLPKLVSLPGDRYEYEMDVLAYTCRHIGKPREIGIKTIYLEGICSSHFHPLWDSLRIYFVLLRFYLST